MGRFLAVVILLVAVALIVNKAMNQPAVDPGAGVEKDAEVLELPAPEAGESTSADEESKEPAAPAATAPQAAEPADQTPTVDPKESAVEVSDLVLPAAATEAVAKAKSMPAETVLLSGELLVGIPGEGELSAKDVESWLADPNNHVVLNPELPFGLAAGAAEIKGVDVNPLTRAKIELGRQLYFDTRLSSDNTISCASCHDPAFGYAKDTQFGIGVDGQEGGRNSPVAYNRILSGAQFWDGRAESLEAQAVGPIANPIEMGNTHEACVETLKAIPGYWLQFAAIFPDEGVTIDNVGKAIASFERAIVTGPAPWDFHQQVANFEKAYADDLEYIKEEQAKDEPELEEEDLDLWAEYTKLKEPLEANAISESAVRGGELFFSDKSGCTACHLGANFTDEKYHNLGVGMAADEPDVGRFSETQDEKDRGAHKTPTVRNVSFTAPYMHDGSQETLLEVVEWYAKGGHPNANLSENVKKLELTEQDKQDLVAFMAEGLKGEFPKVETGRLPQ